MKLPFLSIHLYKHTIQGVTLLLSDVAYQTAIKQMETLAHNSVAKSPTSLCLTLWLLPSPQSSTPVGPLNANNLLISFTCHLLASLLPLPFGICPTCWGGITLFPLPLIRVWYSACTHTPALRGLAGESERERGGCQACWDWPIVAPPLGTIPKVQEGMLNARVLNFSKNDLLGSGNWGPFLDFREEDRIWGNS